MTKEQRDQQIEEQYNKFMDDVMDENYDGDFSEYGFEQPTPEVELTFTDISEQSIFITEPVSTPAPQPRRVFLETRQRFVSRKQEDYSYKLAMEIRSLLREKFNEETSATQWHKWFTVSDKLLMIEELKAGRNFYVKS